MYVSRPRQRIRSVCHLSQDKCIRLIIRIRSVCHLSQDKCIRLISLGQSIRLISRQARQVHQVNKSPSRVKCIRLISCQPDTVHQEKPPTQDGESNRITKDKYKYSESEVYVTCPKNNCIRLIICIRSVCLWPKAANQECMPSVQRQVHQVNNSHQKCMSPVPRQVHQVNKPRSEHQVNK